MSARQSAIHINFVKNMSAAFLAERSRFRPTYVLKRGVGLIEQFFQLTSPSYVNAVNISLIPTVLLTCD